MASVFWLPTEVRFGWGALDGLGEVAASRALVVADRVTVDLGFAERVGALLRRNGAEVAVFADVEAEPARETCAAGAEVAAEFRPDLIVALGGGSVMDAAKAVWALYETPGVPLADLIALRAIHPDRQSKAKFVAIPTTSGTGSEVGGGAIITDRGADPPVKHALRTGFPHLALVDPVFPSTMPPAVTAATGYDALVHAAESYVSLSATPVTRALAVGAIRTIRTWLPRAVDDGADRDARERLHSAATIGGMCMRGGLGIVHAAAHAAGAVFGVPHGVINAVMVPQGVAFNAVEAAGVYAELADGLGLAGADERASVANLLRDLDDLRRRVNLPTSLREAGVSEPALDAVLPRIAANALRDGNMTNNPRRPTADDMASFYRDAWAGRFG